MGALRDFVADLLDSEGAAIEPVEPDGLDVLAPEPLRAAMGWPELARLGFGAQLPCRGDADRARRRLARPFRRRCLATAAASPSGSLSLPSPVAPPGDPERLLDGALDLRNAVWRLRDAKPAWTRCLLLAFRYTAMSDEKARGAGLARLQLRHRRGYRRRHCSARLRQLLARDVEWHAPEPDARRAAGPAGDAPMLATARVQPLLDHHVRRDLEPFLRAMRRRLDRDCGRSPRVSPRFAPDRADEACRAGGRATGDKAESDRKRETMRVAAIEREYAAKLDDLRHNYALRVTVDWMQGLVLFAPVHRYEVLIKRRKGQRHRAIDWHPAARMMEPPPCDWGLGLERARLVCDDHLHLTDPSGQAPCPSCGKAWCRACHSAACPRCGRAV